MLYSAHVTYSYTKYMDDTRYPEKSKFHTVEADSEDEARKKINNHYDKVKSCEYDIYYSVHDIEFFEHIA